MSIRSLLVGLFGIGLLAMPTASYAVPAPPYPFSVEQPDGTSFLITAEGDEFGMRVETQEGYTIVRGPGGWWQFAVAGANGSLLPSGIIPGQGNPATAGIARHLPLGAAELALAKERRAAFARSRSLHPVLAERKRLVMETAGPAAAAGLAAAAPGAAAAAQDASAALAPASFRLAVLLIEFPASVTEAAVPHTYSPAQISELLLSNRTYTTSPLGNLVYGSMRDYYDTASYGKFQLIGQVFPWVMADYGYSSYPDSSVLRQEAIVKSGVDLSQFDAYAVIWAGHADGVHYWPAAGASERWYMSAEKFGTYASGEDLSDVGVHCHELGHVLGLPDLYTDPHNVSYWGLMGAGNYGGAANDGWRPTQLLSSDKDQLGWVYPVTVGGGSGGTFSLRAWNDYPDAVKLVSQRSVFYLENRQKTGYDADLVGAGVLVFHEDFPVNPYMVDIEEADGDTGYDAGAPFPGTSGNTSFGCSTTPAATDVDGTCSVNITQISVAGGTATFSAAVNWPAAGAGITVNGSGNFPNIYTAIQTATSGQSVQVPAGTFAEQVMMRPGINLLGAGQGSSILTDTGGPESFMVGGAEDTTFSGFTVQGYLSQRTGISVGLKGNGARIVNNSFVGTDRAIDTTIMITDPLNPGKGSLVVANNVFYGNNFGLQTLSGNNFLFFNNVLVNNSYGIFQVYAGTPSYLVDYNDFYGNSTDLLQIARRDIGHHNLSTNPLLRNAAAGDYTLLAGSPCINAGNPDPTYNDLDGSRNDMGVFGGPFAPVPLLSITTASLPAGSVGVAYSQTVVAKGGRTPYSWSIAAGSLPSGLGLNTTAGVISGTPTAAGTFGFTVQVTDARSISTAKALSIQINAASLPDLVVTAVSGPTSGTRGKKYTFSATVKNQGAATAEASTLTFYLSTDATITTGDIKLSDVSISSLAAAASKSVTSSVTLATSLPTGTYYIGAIADRAGVVAESNEGNNWKAGNTILVK